MKVSIANCACACCTLVTLVVLLVVFIAWDNPSFTQFQVDEALLYSSTFPDAFYDYSKKMGGKNGNCKTEGLMKGEGCFTVDMPGPKTTTFLDYTAVRDGMSAMVNQLVSGEYARGNLFGMFWCTKFPFEGWPQPVIPGLGYDLANHAALREPLDEILAPFPYNPAGPTVEPWSLAGVRSSARKLIARKKSEAAKAKTAATVSSEEIHNWVIEYLHEVEMGLSLTASEVKAFDDFQTAFLVAAIAPLPNGIAKDLLTSFAGDAIGAGPKLEQKRNEWTTKYEAAIAGKWPAWSAKKVGDAAIGMVTANVFAGGVSVSTMIASTLAQVYNKDARVVASGGDSTLPSFADEDGKKKDGKDVDVDVDLRLAAWETLRLNPPAHATTVLGPGADTDPATATQSKYFIPTASRDPMFYGMKASVNESTAVWNKDRPLLLSDAVVARMAATTAPTTKEEAAAWYSARSVTFFDFGYDTTAPALAGSSTVGDAARVTGKGLGRDPNARYCPGKWLALAMIEGFIAELDVGDWVVQGGKGEGKGGGGTIAAMPNGYQKGSYFGSFTLELKPGAG